MTGTDIWPAISTGRTGINSRRTMKISNCVNTLFAFDVKGNEWQLRECGDGAEVVVDVEHGGVQEGVDVLETL